MSRAIAHAVAFGLIIGAFGPVVQAGALASAAEVAEPGPIRLLIITLDTLRADHLGAYGYAAPTSPAIDRFAGGATRFEDVTCSMPTTLPSHLTILTGLTPAQHGITENGMIPTRDLTSVFEVLEREGARTAAVVSARVLNAKYLKGLGIDEIFFGDGEAGAALQVSGDAVTDQAVSWLTGVGDEPFALWLHYFDTHEPYTPPPAFAARFADGYDGPLSDALATDWLVALNGEAASELTERDRQHVVDLYDAEIAFLDAQLDRLFAFLTDRGLWAKTLIVLTGDHGQAHGEHGFWGHGEQLLEPIIKVPLLVKLPGQETPKTVRDPAQTLDILPTITEYFGLETPPARAGRSLLPALRGGELKPSSNHLEGGGIAPRLVERRTYSTSAPERRGLVLHQGPWKLTFYREADGSSYHLGRTSGEGGLDGENFYTRGSREERLLRQIVAARDTARAEPQDLSPETLEMLRSLGYVQ